jgi:PAS domain S-box-containing protein
MTSTSHVAELDLLRKQVSELSRQLAEQDRLLQEKTRHLRIAQSMAHVGSWEWEIESGRMTWSDELYELFGQRPGELGVTYDTFLAALLPDDHERMIAAMNAALAGTAPFDIECRMVRPDGEVRTIHFRGEIRRSHTGHPLLMSGVTRDLTDRKGKEFALQQSEAYFRTLIEHSSDIITVLDLDGTIQFESPSFERLLGYSQHEIDGRIAFEFVHPDDLPTVLERFLLVIQRPGEPQMAEFRFRHKNGSWRSFEGIGRAIQDQQGNHRVLVNSRDISERKHAEEALRLNEERYARATAIGRVGVWELDVASGTYYGDVNLKVLFGYDGDELSTDPYVWLNLVHPEDQSIALDHWQRIVSGAMDHYNYEIRMIRKDGSVIWTEVRGRAVRNRDGQVNRLIGATVDITERKMTQEALAKSEGQLRTVLNALPVGVWLTDQSGQSLLSNPAAKQIWSNIREIELAHLIGRWQSHEPVSETHRSALSHMLARGIGPVQETLDLECIDGTRKTIRKTTVPVFDDASNMLGALILNEDISNLRQAEAALKLTQFSVDRAVEGFLWIAADGRILNVNQAACRMLEYPSDELTTLRMHDITPSLFPETWAAQWNDLKRNGSLTFESKHWSKNGRVLDMEVTANYLCYEGREYNCLIMRDVSERKRAEGALRRSHAFLRQVIDADPNFIFAKDREGKFTLANKAVADCYGTTVEQLIGKKDSDFNPNRGEVEFFREMDHDVLESLQDRFIPEEAITDVTGRIRWLQTVKRPMCDEHGLPMVLGASTEITERKRVEEALRQRERDLRMAMQERERISEDLHDGILQSLYAVGLGLESCKPLMRQRKHEQATVLLEQAIGQLNHVMTEVRNFIAGLESQVLQGGDFATALQTMVQTLSASTATACRVSIEEAAARQLSTEQALHLMNVVREALSNSLRHSRAKRITVSLKPLAEVIRLAVTDNGVGFKPAVAQGVGHGLANMVARAQKIGGRFVVRSRPRKGTKILLDLPR